MRQPELQDDARFGSRRAVDDAEAYPVDDALDAYPADVLDDYPADEDLEGYERGRLRRILPFIALVLLAALVLWTSHPLLPQRRFDAEGRPLTAAGQPIPRSPQRVLRDGAWDVTYEFRFEDAVRSVSVSIPQEDYAASESRPAAMEVDPSESRDTWTRRYYTRQLAWPEQHRAVGLALRDLRAIRDALGLSSDEYVRLMNAFVGTMPYDSEESNADENTKAYPCSLLVEGIGVCEDKSMLLGALLAAEGYDAALLLLEEDNHMAVGVRSDTRSYKGVPYVFIEVTGVSVREPEQEYQEPVKVGKASKAYKSKPLVVPLTSGGTRFGGE